VKIVVLDGPLNGQEFALGSDPVSVGRKDEADITLAQDARVSRVHCQVSASGGGTWLEDLGSTNGTWLGETQVRERVPLEPRQVFRVGGTSLCLMEEGDTDLPAPEPGPSAPVAPLEEEDETRAVPRLEEPPEREVMVTGFLDVRRLTNPELGARPEECVERMQARLALFQDISQALAGKLEMKEVLGTVADSILEVLPAERLYVLLVGGGEITPIVTRHRGGAGDETVSFSRTIINRTLEEKIAVLLHDAMSDDHLKGRASIALAAIRSAICVPIVHRDEVKAVIHMDATSARAFTQADLEMVTAIANQAGLALANSDLFEELRTAYRELKEAQDRLIQSEKLSTIGTLAASVAHDIGNVLTPIQAISSKVLKSVDLDERLKEIFERQIQRLKTMTQQLLSFSRQLPPEMAPSNLNQGVEESVSLVRTEARHSGVEIVTELDPDLPPATANLNRLDQVFINLMINAFHAMDQTGGGELVVRTYADDESCCVSITDTGPGIPDKILQKIFEPFFSTKGEGGTGLGLHSCRNIVEGEHKGKLEVATEVGKGTTFTIRLPRA